MTANLPSVSSVKSVVPNPAWASLRLFDRTGWKRVVRAYQDFKGEPGFIRVVPIEEIRAKEGNLSIVLYAGGETQAQTDAATESPTAAPPDSLARWLKSSRSVRASLRKPLSEIP